LSVLAECALRQEPFLFRFSYMLLKLEKVRRIVKRRETFGVKRG
jgi:hypothetical protein